MAEASKKVTKQAAIPPHPAVPTSREIGELCADVFRHAVKLARQQGVNEQAVEQAALSDVRDFMSACIRQSKADWKAYTRDTGVHAAYVEAKAPAKRKKARARKAG